MDPRGDGWDKCLKEALVKLRDTFLKTWNNTSQTSYRWTHTHALQKFATSTSLQKRVYLQMIICNCATKFPQRDSLNSDKCKHSPPKIPPSNLCADLPSLKWICHWQLPLLDLQSGVTGWTGLGGCLFFCWQKHPNKPKQQRSPKFFPTKTFIFPKGLATFLVVWMLGWNHICFLFVSFVRL